MAVRVNVAASNWQEELLERHQKKTMHRLPNADPGSEGRLARDRHPVMTFIDRKTGLMHAAGDPKAGCHAGAAR